MIELSRTVRFCLNNPPDDDAKSAVANAFSAWPAMRGLGRYYELNVVCAGQADPVTGYFMNIRRIDEAVRDTCLPLFSQALVDAGYGSKVAMGRLLARSLDCLQQKLDRTVSRVLLQLTPYHSLEILTMDTTRLTIRQRYEFSAAHRLHVDQLSDEQNRETFGKCNNPSGHGHNYEIEIAVDAQVNETGHVMDVGRLDELVSRHVIEKLDHKHLNVDVEEFKNLNPTVENIVKVVFNLLDKPVEQLDCELQYVSVWETGKTVCTYRKKI